MKPTARRNALLFYLLLGAQQSLVADTHFVSLNGGRSPPFTDWLSAATDIKSAVSVAGTEDVVLVSNGLYVLDQEIVLTNDVTVQSHAGSAETVVSGNGATRCFRVNAAKAVLRGFTITGGYAKIGGGILLQSGLVDDCIVVSNATWNSPYSGEGQGGGIYCAAKGRVQGCYIGHNSANGGGGVYATGGGSVWNCLIVDNAASNAEERGGGGIMLLYGAAVANSLILGNTTSGIYGGGAGAHLINAAMDSCTVIGNIVQRNLPRTFDGGGIAGLGGFSSTVRNSIVRFNEDETGTENNTYGSISYVFSCSTPLPSGVGNLADDPLVALTGAQAGLLLASSPCIDAGTNLAWMAGAADLGGKPRVIHGRVDMGAHEVILPSWDSNSNSLPDWWEWLYSHSLTGMSPEVDSDEDGMGNLDEYLADTDPNSAASVLAITAMRMDPFGPLVEWRGGTAAWQYVERRNDLCATDETWLTIFTNQPPTAVTDWMTDPGATNRSLFYRIRAMRP